MARASHPRLSMKPRASSNARIFLRSVGPKNANRPSKDRIHHTESAVRERGDFRERREVLGPRRAQILEQSDGLGQHAPIAGEDHVLGAVARADRRARSGCRRRRPTRTARRRGRARRRVRSVTRTARPSGNRFESVTRSIQGCAREPAGQRSEVEREQVPPAPRATSAARISSVRARVLPETSKRAQREARARDEAEETERRGERRAAPKPTRRAIGVLRRLRGTTLPRRRNGASFSSRGHASGTPLRTARRRPAPRVTSRSPGWRVCSRQSTTSCLFRDIDDVRVPRPAGRLGHQLARDARDRASRARDRRP